MMNLREPCRDFIRHSIGDGRETDLWFDLWHPNSPLAQSINDPRILHSGLPSNAVVANFIFNGEWVSSQSHPQYRDILQAIPPSQRPYNRFDRVLLSPTGKDFSISSLWDVIRPKGNILPWVNMLWFRGNIPRHAVILWMAVKQRLYTQDRMLNFGIINRISCVFCRLNIECHDHLFFECSLSQRIWLYV